MLGNKRGFTLIEVVVVMAIALIAMGMIMSFYIYTQKTYNSGTNRAVMHTNLRLTSERITREIRFATNLTVLEGWHQLPTGPENVAPGYFYIFYDQERKTIRMLSRDGYWDMTEPIMSEVIFSAQGNTVHYILTATRRGRSYTHESSVFLMNTTPLTADEYVPAFQFTRP